MTKRVFDSADEATAARKLEEAERILYLARCESWRLQRHDEMFVSLVHRGFSCGLWTMENGDSPAGQDMDAWRKQVVEAARFIADCAYPKPDESPRVTERERLVQKIIGLENAYARGEDAPKAILEAVRELAAWSAREQDERLRENEPTEQS